MFWNYFKVIAKYNNAQFLLGLHIWLHQLHLHCVFVHGLHTFYKGFVPASPTEFLCTAEYVGCILHILGSELHAVGPGDALPQMELEFCVGVIHGLGKIRRQVADLLPIHGIRLPQTWIQKLMKPAVHGHAACHIGIEIIRVCLGAAQHIHDQGILSGRPHICHLVPRRCRLSCSFFS